MSDLLKQAEEAAKQAPSRSPNAVSREEAIRYARGILNRNELLGEPGQKLLAQEFLRALALPW